MTSMTGYIKRIISKINSGLKEKVRRWAFSDINEKNDERIESYKENLGRFYEKNADITQFVRQKLAGFDPEHLKSEDLTVQEFVGGEDEYKSFLEDIHNVKNNEGLWKLFDYLIAHQVIYIARWAENDKSVNFGRSSINGITLVKEEVERLDGIYRYQFEQEEDYDEYDVV